MQLVIAHKSGSRIGTKEVFERESVLIGRGDHNDSALDPFVDSTVSAHHAEIRIEDGRIVLYDMGSLNGTFLNGNIVKRAELAAGDTIGLGRHGPRLSFDFEGELPAFSAKGTHNGESPDRGPSHDGHTRREVEMPELDETDEGGLGARLWVLLIVGAAAATAAWALLT